MVYDYKLHLIIRTPQACLWEQSVKISYSWGDEEPYQEFNSFEEAWDTAKKDACNEAEIASIEANDETCEIGLTFEKEEDRGRISLHYTYDNSYCYYDVLPQEVTDTDCIRQSEKNPS